MNRFVYANPDLCIGCDTCLAACAEAHRASGAHPLPRLVIARSGKISMPITCRHCDNAPCVKACPLEAIKVNAGVVELDESVCNSCMLCVPACPFGVIASSEKAAGIAAKCDLCDTLKQGPVCVQACPTKALFVVDAKSLRRSGNDKRKAATQCMPHFIKNPDK